jgi:hypothetical protein
LEEKEKFSFFGEGIKKAQLIDNQLVAQWSDSVWIRTKDLLLSVPLRFSSLRG